MSGGAAAPHGVLETGGTMTTEPAVLLMFCVLYTEQRTLQEENLVPCIAGGRLKRICQVSRVSAQENIKITSILSQC